MKKILIIISLLLSAQSIFAQEFVEKWAEHINSGKKLYMEEKYVSAMDEFKLASETIPTDTLAYTFIINCAQYTKQANEAFIAIQKLQKLKFQSSLPYQTCIPILLNNNFSAENLLTVINKGLEKFPNDQEIQFQSVLFYSKYNIKEQFVSRMNLYLETHPRDYNAYVLYVNTVKETFHDSLMYIDLIKKAITIFPDSMSFPKMEYSYYLKQKKYDEAQGIIESLIDKKSNDPELYYNLALLYFEKEEYAESAEICKKAIELKPDYVDAIYNVGTFYYYQGMEYNSALSDMSVEQYKMQGKDFQDSSLFYFKEAKPYFEKATNLNPTDLNAYENLNTIKVLIDNIEANNFLDKDWQESNSSVFALSLADIRITYQDSSQSLVNNSQANLTLQVINQSDSTLHNIAILLNQPITTEGLSFPSKSIVDSLQSGETLNLNMILNYNYKAGNVTGIEEAEGAKNKLRIYALSDQLKISDLSEISLDINQNETLNIPVVVNNQTDSIFSTSETQDINFDPSTIANNFLIIIGINDYAYWPKLNNAVNDALSFENELVHDYGFKSDLIYELINENATQQGLRNALIKIKREITENDNLIIYYAGHGYYDKEFDNGFWIPCDAHEDNQAEYIPSTTLIKYLTNIPAKHTVIFADACFSGSLFIQDQNYKFEKNNDRIPSRWGFSSGNLEFVADGSAGSGSPFANTLIEILKDNKQSEISISDIILTVSQEVRTKTQQTPVGRPLAIPGNQGGEFVFYKQTEQ